MFKNKKLVLVQRMHGSPIPNLCFLCIEAMRSTLHPFCRETIQEPSSLSIDQNAEYGNGTPMISLKCLRKRTWAPLRL